MKALARINLIELIGTELQAKMTFTDIDTYLTAYNIKFTVSSTDFTSKRVYVKQLLATASERVILDIADELGIQLNDEVKETNTFEATFWIPSHFKLFLSHISSFKKNTSLLQNALKPYGISGFVAHVDIEPTKHWESEIEAGLHTMDALAAILMPGFKESNWTDQEVGFAVGRGVLIIPLIKGLDPYGFISKYQGLQVEGKTVTEVAANIFKILSTSPKTRERLITCLVETTLKSLNQDEALQKLSHLNSLKELPTHHLERLRDEAPTSTELSKGAAKTKLIQLLDKRGIKASLPLSQWDDFDEDIPF